MGASGSGWVPVAGSCEHNNEMSRDLLGCDAGPLNQWYPTTTLHGVRTQKTST